MEKKTEVPMIIPTMTVKDLAKVFSGKETMENIVAKIRAKARDLIVGVDSTTAEGRKELAQVATKVNKSKEFIDEYGKGLVADQKKALKVVDDKRKIARDELDLLRAEVRLPIVAYEEKCAKEQAIVLAQEKYGIDWDAAIVDNEMFDLRKAARDADVRAKVAEGGAKMVAEVVSQVIPATMKTSAESHDTWSTPPASIAQPTQEKKRMVNLGLIDFFKSCGATEDVARVIVVKIVTGVTSLLKINY